MAGIKVFSVTIILGIIYFQYKKISYLRYLLTVCRENQIQLSIELSQEGKFEEYSKFLIDDDHYKSYLQAFHSLNSYPKESGRKHRVKVLKSYEEKFGKIESRNYYNEPSDLVFLLFY
ncbi:MAG: hypothetical protein VXV96_10105 [Bdellovibrionota bacterium]|nr:hypothetical protein [Bdellovibrionota bacterium]